VKHTCEYSCSFTLPARLDQAFELFSQPSLLNALTPRWFDLRPLGAVPERLGIGSEISYALHWRGLPLHWTSRIVECQPPHRLTYEQVRGPYRSFCHEHRFSAAAGGTRVVDRVVFRGPAGATLDRLLVRRELERIFRFRARAARARCAGPLSALAPATASTGDAQAGGAEVDGASLMP
jgi:ligand-binding SRPBCC domain-containing protein